MRIICSTINGEDVEGEVVDGKNFDAGKGSYDLNEMFDLRRDDGEVLQVGGWLVGGRDRCRYGQHVHDVSV